MNVRAYLALWRMRMRTLLQYRVAALAGVATQLLFGLVMVSVLTAFYHQSDAAQPMLLSQTITYTWLGQAMLGMLPWNIDAETGASVRTGQVAYDLTRPIDLYTHWYVRCIALRSAPTLLKAIPMFVIALLLPRAIALTPPTPLAFGAWLLSVCGALLLSCAVTTLMQSSLFWTVTGLGIVRIVPSFVTLLSGNILPLPLFPDALQLFLRVQPFAGLSDLPSRIFCGALPPSAVFSTLALQWFWTVVFVGMGRAMVSRGLRHVVLAGG